MAYQFADPFDHYNTASEMYETVAGSILYSSAYRRFAPPAGMPGQGIKFASNGAYVAKNLQSNQSTLIIFVAFNFNTLGNSGSGGNPFLIVASNGVQQCALNVTSAGAIQLVNLSAGTAVATTSTGMFFPGIWYGFELEITISSGSGVCKLWAGGTQVINATGINTFRTTSTVNQVYLGDIFDNGLGNSMADDFRVWDNTGSYQNAPLGTDRYQVSKLASGAGGYSQWTPNGAAANWQCTNDNPPNLGTTSVTSTAAGNYDAYGMPIAGFTAAPSMVVARSYVKKTGTGTPTFQNGVRSGTTNGLGNVQTTPSGYIFWDSCISLDPNISGAWTAATADAAQHLKYEAS
jgi:hypothetical protein